MHHDAWTAPDIPASAGQAGLVFPIPSWLSKNAAGLRRQPAACSRRITH